MNTCSTCRFWSLDRTLRPSRLGECSCPKFVLTYDDERVPDDGLMIENATGERSFWTGPKFGCRHWTGKF